jgi:hypothetical protein
VRKDEEQMKKVILEVAETLVYRREIEVEVPDEWNEDHLEHLLNKAQREEFLDDFMHVLKKNGVDISNGWDDSLDSPDSCEVECDGFEILDDEKEKESV